MEQFTDDLISRLAQLGKRTVVRDTDLRGFGVLALPSGVVSFFVEYIADGRKRHVTVGQHPAITVADARASAGAIIAKPSLARHSSAGRKPKGHSPPSSLPAHVLDASLGGDDPDAIRAEAQAHALPIVRRLVETMLTGKSDAKRVRACNSILDRAYGKPSVDTGVDMLPFMVKPQTSVPGDVRAECKKFARAAIETLNAIAERSESEGARISAALSLLDRGLGTVGAAARADDKKEQTFGKKEAQKIAAQVRVGGGGKFAAPSPPPGLKQ